MYLEIKEDVSLVVYPENKGVSKLVMYSKSRE